MPRTTTPRMSRAKALAASLSITLGAALAACGPSGPYRTPEPRPSSPVVQDSAPGGRISTTSTDIRVTLLQINDLYEITPVGGGAWGGPARVATLLRRLEAWNPNTRAVIAGDFFSPSALGTARVDGERLAGRQMVAVLNAMGLDHATFGNHEFDIGREAFLARLEESEFSWFSSNVTDASGAAFPGTHGVQVLHFTGTAGDTLRLALIGVTKPDMAPEWVRVSDPVAAVREAVDAMGDSVQAIVAITHLDLEDDIALAEAVPELDLIMGGHEHENILARRGPDLTPIAKADANVRTVYVHDLRWDPSVQRLEVDSRLMPITPDLPDDPETDAEVGRWLDRGWAGFREAGFEPEAVIVTVPETLDGREAVVRNRSTTLTDLIVEGMRAEVEGPAVALLNAGSIRIDDQIAPGPLTQYDVIRILPFGGAVVEVEMSTALLAEVLAQGRANVGSGGMLHGNAEMASEGLRVEGRVLDADAPVRALVPEFLLTGLETGLDYFTPDHPELTVIAEHRDIRQTLIDALERRWGNRP